jgi:hypothetical protein
LAIAAGLAVLGTIFLVFTLTSIGGLVWIGTPVHGVERDGIVYYSYGGQQYTIDDSGSYRTGPRTVYVDSSKPTRAVLATFGSQAIQDSIVGVPWIAALAFFVLAIRRKWRYVRYRRDRETRPEQRPSYGEGLDPELIRRVLATREVPRAATAEDSAFRPPQPAPPRPPEPGPGPVNGGEGR